MQQPLNFKLFFGLNCGRFGATFANLYKNIGGSNDKQGELTVLYLTHDCKALFVFSIHGLLDIHIAFIRRKWVTTVINIEVIFLI